MKTDPIKISVIVPVFNAEKYIEDCIKALMEQNFPREQYEIIIIDNNSKDDSFNMISRFPSVRRLKAGKQGAYSARNIGIAHARGDIIAFTDADCKPDKEWLLTIDNALRNSELKIILGSNRFANDSFIMTMLANYESEKAKFVFSNYDPNIYYGYTNNMAVRAGLFKEFGFFHEIRRGADVVFVRIVVDNYGCDSVKYIPEMLIHHMEIVNPTDYLNKQLVYGKSFCQYHQIKSAKVLNTPCRIKILKAVLSGDAHSPFRKCIFLIILFIGAIYYEMGRRGITGK